MGFVIKFVFFCVFSALLISYYGDDLVRVIGNEVRLASDAAPKELRSSANLVHSLEIPIKQDGHYWLSMNVNHQEILFIVDTGASSVTLSYADAENLNLHLFDNDYDVIVNTASGQTTMAAVSLDVVSVGAIELYDVKALVAREGMLSVSLLGMNYLNKLERFEFRDQKLIIEQ